MHIFDDIIRTDLSPARSSESHAAFLNRVHTPYFESTRQLVEDWFTRLDVSAQVDVRARLQDGNDQNFCSAFWELYLHETLTKAGYKVHCHPDVPGTSRKPDFLAESSQQSFYLEAKCLAQLNDKQTAADKRKNQVYDAIQKIDSPNFFLWVDVKRIGPTSPSARALCRALENWLSLFDPDEVAQQLESRPIRDELPTYEWEDQSWHITFQPIPKSKDSRGKAGVRPIGIFGGGSMGFVDDATPLKKVLADKGSAYGKMDIPFIVAIATSFVGPDGEDVQDALYGTPQVEVSFRPDGTMATRPKRAPNGYWHNGTNWCHQNVSAVLIARDIYPWTVTRIIPTLWEHPVPTHSLICPPMWGRIAAVDDELTFIEPQVRINEVLGLPDPWPTGKEFDPFPGQ